ncbi:MAG: hypothetical protein ACREDW_06820, partial [Aestuariivirgaceae bacterium]
MSSATVFGSGTAVSRARYSSADTGGLASLLRILKDRCNHSGLIELELIENEVVGMSGFYVVFSQNPSGEVLKIGGDYCIASRMNCSRQNVPIVCVRQWKDGNHILIASYQT